MIRCGGNIDCYILIQILGNAGSPKYRKIVEPFLRNKSNSQLSALAIKVLCDSWGLASEYRDELMNFLDGVSWDVDGYARLQTISTVGEHLRKNSDIEFLKRIYNIFSDKFERPIMRSAAYFSLCRSEGMAWNDIPPASKILDFSREVNQEMLERVKHKIKASIH